MQVILKNGKLTATHRDDQIITIGSPGTHYPTSDEIIIVPDGTRIDFESKIDPRDAMTKEQKEEVLILTKERELKQASEPDFRQAAIDDLKAAGILKG